MELRGKHQAAYQGKTGCAPLRRFAASADTDTGMAPRGARAAAAASSGSEDEEEEAGFSRSYFLAKEKEPSSGKKRARAAAGKLSDLNLVDEQVSWRPTPHPLITSSPHLSRYEPLVNLGSPDPLQVLRASLSEIPPKHEEEVEALTRSYKDQYRNWLFELRLLPKFAALVQSLSRFG